MCLLASRGPQQHNSEPVPCNGHPLPAYVLQYHDINLLRMLSLHVGVATERKGGVVYLDQRYPTSR